MKYFLPILLLLLSFWSQPLQAETYDVYVLKSEPNLMADEKSGFDVDLLNEISRLTGDSYNIVPTDSIDVIFGNVSNGSIGAGGISISERREALFDFVPYMRAGISPIFTKENHESSIIVELLKFKYFGHLWDTLHKTEVAHMVFALCVITFLFANIIWFAERGVTNIDDNYMKGIGQAIWFCIVTQSTVGYGDTMVAKALSKMIVMLLILFGISTFGNYTALTTADMVVEAERYNIQSLDDLKGETVIVKESSYSQILAEKHGAKTITYSNYNDGLIDLLEKNMGLCILTDTPLAKYICANDDSLYCGDTVFMPHDYGFVFPEGDSRMEGFKLAMLTIQESGLYTELKNKWF